MPKERKSLDGHKKQAVKMKASLINTSIREKAAQSRPKQMTPNSRNYFHSNGLPIHPYEDDVDSEEEQDPMCQVELARIDLFSDVNEGEKEIIKLWNLHMLKGKLSAVASQMPLICEKFVDLYGCEIVRKNLYGNLILHMCSLFDWGLVSPQTISAVVHKLQGVMSNFPAGQEKMKKQHHDQLKNWLEVGNLKQEQDLNNNPSYECSISTTDHAATS